MQEKTHYDTQQKEDNTEKKEKLIKLWDIFTGNNTSNTLVFLFNRRYV